MEIKELNLLEILLKQFYARMIDGKITDAKGALAFVFKTFSELRTLITAMIQSVEENKAKQLNDSWQALQTALTEFKILANEELSITEETFAEDPETWKELLSGIFKEKVDTLCSLLNAINTVAKTPVKPEQKLPPFKYSPKYAKLRERNKLYAQNKEKIDEIEYKIKDFLSRGETNREGVTQIIQTGPYAGSYHADLPKPMGDHRIVYSWDGTSVIFETIDTHKRLRIA
jgi:hypothetical protein